MTGRYICQGAALCRWEGRHPARQQCPLITHQMPDVVGPGTPPPPPRGVALLCYVPSHLSKVLSVSVCTRFWKDGPQDCLNPDIK